MNNPLLKLNKVSIGYKNPIVENISANVSKGELVGLLGKNGSGKSTLIKSILGINPIFKGKIQIHQQNIYELSDEHRAQKIAAVFSKIPNLPSISVEELIYLGRLPHVKWLSKMNRQDELRIDTALEMIGIQDLKTKLVTQLSDGQLQLVMIARALVQETDLIVMDEPTAHLDLENQFKIFETISKISLETQKTFLISSHHIELMLQKASQIWWIHDQQFHAGIPEQIGFEQRIFEQFKQESIRFNYKDGSFQFQYHTLQNVRLIADNSELAYWVKHSLLRNNFQISDEGNEVKVFENQIYIDEVLYDSITSFNNALQELKN